MNRVGPAVLAATSSIGTTTLLGTALNIKRNKSVTQEKGEQLVISSHCWRILKQMFRKHSDELEVKI